MSNVNMSVFILVVYLFVDFWPSIFLFDLLSCFIDCFHRLCLTPMWNSFFNFLIFYLLLLACLFILSFQTWKGVSAATIVLYVLWQLWQPLLSNYCAYFDKAAVGIMATIAPRA